MPTIRQHVKKKAELPFALMFASAVAMALAIFLLANTQLAWLSIVFGLGMFVALGILHVRVTCPRCHMPFRGALGGVIFNYGMLGFRFCPNCGCKLDEPL